jgi:hypothetical protein
MYPARMEKPLLEELLNPLEAILTEVNKVAS